VIQPSGKHHIIGVTNSPRVIQVSGVFEQGIIQPSGDIPGFVQVTQTLAGPQRIPGQVHIVGRVTGQAGRIGYLIQDGEGP
jgi:hypothetical protein